MSALPPAQFPPLPPCPPSPSFSLTDQLDIDANHTDIDDTYSYIDNDDMDYDLPALMACTYVYVNVDTDNNSKRTTSTSHADKQPRPSGRRTPSDSSSSKATEKGREGRQVGGAAVLTVGEGKRSHGGASKAPSLDIDIRNSLILPSLSQRFSVLLPSLSSVPEESLRSLLASQRARANGPALTEREEELLLTELRGGGAQDDWDGQPPASDAEWSGKSYKNGPFGSFGQLPTSASSPSVLTTSTSSPSVLAASEDGRGSSPASAASTAFWSASASPLPTSTSFSSFHTFGVGASDPQAANVKTKSYGFSGGSGMREAEYIRRTKKSTSQKDLKASTSSRKGSVSDGTARDNDEATAFPLPPKISPEKANAYYRQTRRTRRSSASSASERTATPTSALDPTVHAKPRRSKHSPTSSISLNSAGDRSKASTPTTSVFADTGLVEIKAQRSRKRQSMLVGMPAAQAKRISMALEEIGGELQRKGTLLKQSVDEGMRGVDEEEEMLDTAPKADDDQITPERPRLPSDVRSEGSVRSATSSVFPFKMSPTNSTFTGTNTSEAPSPSRLPPSPRSHNLLAHVEEPLPPIPMPVFTPVRSQPVKHRPTLSASTFSPNSPSIPVYVPGQPRPVGSIHRSNPSSSSRSTTPVNYSPAEASHPATTASPADLQRGLDISPPPFKVMPPVAARGSPLTRSQSVNQPSSSHLDNDGTDGNSNPDSFSRRRAGTLTLASTGRRLSSSLSMQPPTPADTIEEEADEEHETDREDYAPSSSDHYMPEVKRVIGRRSVADSRRESQSNVPQLNDVGQGLAPGVEPHERTVSVQGTIESSSGTPGTSSSPRSAPMSPTITLRRNASTGSLSSSFVDPDEEMGVESRWTTVLNINGNNDDKTDLYEMEALSDTERPKDDEQILRKLSGVGLEELALLQGKLVQKARLEREALRGDFDESPVVPITSTMPVMSHPFDQRVKSPILERPLSPPVTAKHSPEPSVFPHPVLPESAQPNGELAGVAAEPADILTPPLTGEANLSRSGSKSNHAIIPARSAPPPPLQPPHAPVDTPSDANDEVVHTPPSDALSRNTSTRAGGRRPLEQDPEVRRDFEARIAAATAALNRTPSTQGARLGRKHTKRGPMVISSPKLMSSTANVPTTPLTPENVIDPAMNKALEKTSGSASKMSLRWKKLAGLRKGPSLSGSEVSPFPLPPPRPQPPVQTRSQASLQRSQSQALKRLDEPIALRTDGETSAPPNLDTFRFPSQEQLAKPAAVPVPHAGHAGSSFNAPTSSPPASAPPIGGLKHMATKLKRNKEDKHSDSPAANTPQSPPSSAPPRPGRAVARAQGPPPPLDLSAKPKTSQMQMQTQSQSQHSHNPSTDPALEKFIEAGRQLGLNQDQLNEMLANKGMLARSGTTASSRSYQSTAPTSASGPPHSGAVPTSPASPRTTNVKRQPSMEKGKKGLFRSLSKKMQNTPMPISTPIPSAATTAAADQGHAAEKQDRVVVRRTMILPDGLVIVPSTPQPNATPRPGPGDSPEASLAPPGPARKQSVRRKPINLSEEDHRLVSNSPPAHKGRFSISGNSGQSSSEAIVPSASASGSGGDLAGLGFLHPNTHLPVGSEGNRSFSGASASSMEDSHARSSTGGSLIDMYAGEEEMLHSPEKEGRRRSDHAASTQAVEICEYADGQVVWNIVDALRTSIAGSVEGEEYVFDPAHSHSRETSFSSSRPGSMAPDGNDVLGGANDRAGWPSRMGGSGVQALNLRHKDRGGIAPKPRPPTDVYFTSSADVADLIDHLSRDLDASHGRIDILPHLNEHSEHEHEHGRELRQLEQRRSSLVSPVDPAYSPVPADARADADPASQTGYSGLTTARPSLAPSPALLTSGTSYDSHSSPFMYQSSSYDERDRDRSPFAHPIAEGGRATPDSIVGSQFEDAPSPYRPTRSSIAPSPSRRLFIRQSMTLGPAEHRPRPSTNSTHSFSLALGDRGERGGLSPSAASFASSQTSMQAKTVEDRLQALLDKLKAGGAQGSPNPRAAGR